MGPIRTFERPPWTLAAVIEMVGQVRDVEMPGGVVQWRIVDGRLTRNPRVAEFLVEDV